MLYIPVTDAEGERLKSCVREPIRRPGAIQPHGMMLTTDRTTWTILQASENSYAFVERSAQDLLGTSLADLIGHAAVARLSAVLNGELESANPVPIVCNAVPLDVIVHAVDGVAVVEIEPALPPGEFSSTPAVYAALSRLGTLATREQLWDCASRELKLLAGFDHVMVYHFHPDGHGEIVAEQRSDDSMESYLGLHYPASDIPAQARDLYLTKISRSIASTEDMSFPLQPALNPVTGEPLDLSGAELRSVSPHHLQFMRNMGQAATLSFSLIVDGELVGMITCAHRTPRRLPYTLRQALEAFTGQVAALLGSMSEIRRLKRSHELLALRKELIKQFSSSGDTEKALLRGPVTLFDLIPARTAALRHQGRISIAGEPLDKGSVERLVARRLADGGQLPFASSSLAAEHPELAAIVPDIAGVLVVPLGPAGDFLAWFRPEITETIKWLGDQSESNRDSTLSPRNSFSAWSGIVSGVAEPWANAEGDAIELGRDLNDAFLRKVESTLAQFALHDALTGLPNRRLLMDRLEHSLAGYARGGRIAMLFIDIDSFKWFNDSLGHEGGDAVLTQIAERLLSSARAADTVARLGGDEFVVLCEETDAEAARGVAERLLVGLRAPLTFNGQEIPVTVSIGVATARRGDTAAVLIRRADASMYRAKRGGKARFNM